MNIKIKIKKGDEVIVLAGKDKGKKGKIINCFLNK
jgi:KOW motif.